ncbi:hypothetical protein JHW43_004821 [Diplocarpon mali]|nr:hypothetical protein JHW43_004821 [Diplocarpon mali]
MAYNASSRVNMMDYIGTLNTVPPEGEMQASPDFLEDDLAMFTNANFFDFDLGQNADLQPTAYNGEGRRDQAVAPDTMDMKSLDFMNTAPMLHFEWLIEPARACLISGAAVCIVSVDVVEHAIDSLIYQIAPYHVPSIRPSTPLETSTSWSRHCWGKLSSHSSDFPFPDFNPFPQNTFTDTSIPLAPINTSLYHSPESSPPLQTRTTSTSHKRKSDSIGAGSPISNAEDAARNAAEEDKRRRNTAASARFRVKKKQREQALERSAKDMSDKVAALEGRINQLETENKWLKNLITEKNDSKEDIATLWKRYSAENAERKGSERKDGVGTRV